MARLSRAPLGLCVCVCLCILLGLALLPAARARSIHVSLHTSWNATSPAAEALLHLHHTCGASTALRYLRHLVRAAPLSTPQPITLRAERRLLRAAASTALDHHPLALAALSLSSAARLSSPLLHTHYAHAASLLSYLPPATSVFAVLLPSDALTASLHLHPHAIHDPSQAVHTLHYPSTALATAHSIPLPSLCPSSSSAPKPRLYLYLHPLSPSLADWLSALHQLQSKCSHTLAIRLAPPPAPYPPPHRHAPLSGFLAHATLRSTEFRVVDDTVFRTSLFPDCPPGLPDSLCRSPPLQHDDDPYQWNNTRPDDFKVPHALASHFVHHHAQGSLPSALDSLSLLVHDAPAVLRSARFNTGPHAARLSDKLFDKAVRKFRSETADRDLLFLNDFPIDIYALKNTPFNILRCLSSMSVAAHHFSRLATDTAQPIPSLPKVRPDPPARLRVLLPVRSTAPRALVWFNDVFSDSRYKNWPGLDLSDRASVDDFVARVQEQRKKVVSDMSMHLKLVKTRAHHLSMLIVLDAADMEQLPYLTVPQSVVQADLPIRVGAILVPNTRPSKLIAAVFYHFLNIKGRKLAVQFVTMLQQVLQYFGGGMNVEMNENVINVAFQQLVPQSGSPYASAAEILQADDHVAQILGEARKFAEDMQLLTDDDKPSKLDNGDDQKRVSLICLFNGVVVKDIGRDVLPLAVKEQERVADMLSSGVLSGKPVENISSEQWIEADQNLIVINSLSKNMRGGAGMGNSMGLPQKLDLPDFHARDVSTLQEHIKDVSYLNDVPNDFKVTLWLAAGREDDQDFLRLANIVKDLATSAFAKRTTTRLAIIEQGSPLHHTIMEAAPLSIRDAGIVVINGHRIRSAAVQGKADLIAEIAAEYQSVSIPDGIRGELRFLHRMYEKEIAESCKSESPTRHGITREKVKSALDSSSASKLCIPEGLAGVSNDPEAGGTPLSVLAVIDPMDPDAYLRVGLLRSLREAFGEKELSMGLVIAPKEVSLKRKVEVPKTFYRFLFPFDDVAQEDTSERQLPTRLSFDRLPQSRILTVAVEAPRAWFVSSYSTNYDMDNVILNSIAGDNDIFTEYQLQNLIVEGSCIDETEQPPQGLKLMLANDMGVMVDTLVMANLGYFQLKVPTPGTWWLSLARGVSSRVFMLRAMEMIKEGSRTVFEVDENGRVPIPVDSLNGAGGILLRVKRRPGMEGKSVLESGSDVDDLSGDDGSNKVVLKFKATLKKMFGRRSLRSDEEASMNGSKDKDTIHVFSVASGHLYERFLKIMITTVTKNASRKVKFWLLENYLSPSFKKLLPEFAKEHGAELGMVTYKWPGWLRAQTEKQRIIWAYKILFLDVLFPLDVGRIIFVDSDQVIRGDVAELMDIDLKGAPYGYVPFCDSRKEVEGYRFWKTGFWNDTLKGAKYRISALYVVDLIRFRETAAGDTLRFMYQSLSADPNSLSNLDQDLPNYASVTAMAGNVVPIFDLPQDWLWCESWCDDESKKTAKAIDLCNNPMTKEPKLDSAKRIIAEWVDTDASATELTETIYKRLMERKEAGEEGSKNTEPLDEDDDSVKTEL